MKKKLAYIALCSNVVLSILAILHKFAFTTDEAATKHVLLPAISCFLAILIAPAAMLAMYGIFAQQRQWLPPYLIIRVLSCVVHLAFALLYLDAYIRNDNPEATRTFVLFMLACALTTVYGMLCLAVVFSVYVDETNWRRDKTYSL